MKRHQLTWKTHSLELGGQTRIMGIVNITPDSFSDGGRYFSPEVALAHAEQMVAEGADIIDIGGESTRPFSEPVSAEEECRRVVPVIEKLAGRIPVPVSIDTTKAAVARQAIAAGAAMVNDISALRLDSELGRVIAESNVPVILMHMKGMPADMQVAPTYTDLIGEIYDFLSQAIERAESAGIERAKMIIDPGIGFGKTVAHNLSLIQRLGDFHQLEQPILIGSSRKAFIRKILSTPESSERSPMDPLIETGSQAAVAAAIMNGAQIVRVHDVANTAATVKIVDAIKNANPADGQPG